MNGSRRLSARHRANQSGHLRARLVHWLGAVALVVAGLASASPAPAAPASGLTPTTSPSTTPATTAPAAPDPPPPLFQGHSDGSIWQYVTPPLSGWTKLDNNPATIDVVTDGTTTYQLHNDGTIWQYVGPPITGWTLLDKNPATVQIAASGGNLYQLHRDGTIWKYVGTPVTGWQLLDTNPAAVAILADGANLYQLHDDGSIWQYVTPPITGWLELDHNPDTMDFAASGGNLYQLHRDGSIWKYVTPPITGWHLLDTNPDTAGIVADGTNLYQLHQDGSIWQYVGPPIVGWQLFDNNPAAVGIAAGHGVLYQLHKDGTIWQYVTPPIQGWALLDNNPATDFLTSSSGSTFIPAPAIGSGPVRVSLYGDSLSGEAGDFFNNAINGSGRAVAQVRTFGGTSPCTWFDTMRQDAATFRPQAVVIQFSGTAFSPCMAGFVPGTEAYFFKYAADTETVISIFAAIGARVYIAGSPISLSSQAGWDTLNHVYAAIAVRSRDAAYVDAGAAIELNGQFTWTLPCLYFEPCGVPCKNQAVVPGSNCVRDPEGAHLCPDGNFTPTGYTGFCDEWSSGAFRYALAEASGVVRDFRL